MVRYSPANKKDEMTRSFIVFMFCLLLIGCNNLSEKQDTQSLSSESQSDSEDTIKNVDTIPFYAKKIIDTYHDFNIKFSKNHLIFGDNTSIIFNDEKEKSFVEKLDNCDIEDMFSMTYDTCVSVPAYLNDCGRGRNEELFKTMYGSNEAMARENLVYVDWFGQKLLFSKINGASEQLCKVASELQEYPHLRKYLKNASSFYWRKVRGANRQSAHSYGIAIDINTSYSNYWLWENPRCSEIDKIKYVNRIPKEIVTVFEKYGFIWGGRWYHYDTMHFEYRPELL